MSAAEQDSADGDTESVAYPTWYDIVDEWEYVVGRESSRCEACGGPVDSDMLGRRIASLRPTDVRSVSQVLLCEDCIDDPRETWKPKVEAKRERERREEAVREYGPFAPLALKWGQARRYLTDPTATTLFGRRLLVVGAAVGVVAAAVLGGLLALLALVGELELVLETGATLGDALAAIALGIAQAPWGIAVVVSVAYILHTAERDIYDAQGYTRDLPSLTWLAVAGGSALAGGIVVFEQMTYSAEFRKLADVFAGGYISHPETLLLAGGWLWGMGVAAVAIGWSIRADVVTFVPENWNPRRVVWLAGVRVGALLGGLAFLIGAPGPDAIGVVLTAIGPAAGLGYAALRFPHDRRARDEVLDRYEAVRENAARRLPGVEPRREGDR